MSVHSGGRDVLVIGPSGVVVSGRVASASDKLLPVCVDGKYGYINLRGEIVVPFQYSHASEFSEGLAQTQRQFNYDDYEKSGMQEYFVITDELCEIGTLRCGSCYHNFSEGLLVFERNDKWGYVDTCLQIVIPPSFDNAGDFVDGLAWAAIKANGESHLGVIDRPEGIIDRGGNWVIRPEYGRLFPFNKGEQLTGFTRDFKKWGLIDRQGNRIVESRFHSIGWPNKGLLAAGARVGEHLEYGIINDRGEWLVEPRWDDCDGGFTHDLMSAAINGKWGLVDREGEWDIEPKYTNARKFSDGLCGVYVGGRRDLDYCLWDGKYGFINKAGEMVIEPRFDDVFDFENGVCEVKLIDGDPKDNLSRYGYIDTDGR